MGRKKKYHTEEEIVVAKKRLNRENYLRNKEIIKQKKLNNVEEISKYQKEYREKNKKTLSNKKKEYYKNNKDKFTDYGKQYREDNKDKIRGSKNKYQKDKRNNDPLFKLRCNISSLIRQSMKNKGYKKSSKTHEILGCSHEEFKQHIESQWEDWMSWDNYGNPKDGIYELNKTWDVDHIICLDSAINESEIFILNHHSNLQPLCSYNNRFIKNNNL